MYIDFCISASSNLDLSGLSLVIDCANGANYSVAPEVFKELGCKVIEISTSPDGININARVWFNKPRKNTGKKLFLMGLILVLLLMVMEID